MRCLCRKLPVGAELQPDGATQFRVWAPGATGKKRDVRVVVERAAGGTVDVALEAEPGGYFSGLVLEANAGDRYRYVLEGRPFADPASRFQPDGVFGPSEIVDSERFRWTDHAWRGVTLPGQILYELHIGTFTPEGTWRSALERLPQLAETGITVVEVMPVSDFPGRFGWGYDGVFPFAPTRLYGRPDDFRAFVDRAHQLGLGVILDVVYNHLGPSGCVHREFASAYFGEAGTEWGDALNFDGRDSGPVREYFVSNAGYWIDEFHLDGLRLDAVQSIHDRSDDHVIAAIVRSVRAAARGRDAIVIVENERQESRMLRPVEQGGFGVDAAWNDDFHHSAVVAATGRREAYFSDHYGHPQEFISAAKYGYLFQGQRYQWQKQRRGTRSDGIPPGAFVNFLENHDQVANVGDGTRLRAHVSPGRYRALTALLLLLPGTPMLFQGQEFGTTTPFAYFADHEKELAAAVQKGRAELLAQFPSLATEAARAHLPVPHDPATFERSKLRWDDRDRSEAHVRLHKDLIALRRGDAAFQRQRLGGLDGAVLGSEAWVLRFAADRPADERLLVMNLGMDLVAGTFPEPLTAPPDRHQWNVRWCSEELAYGGTSVSCVVTEEQWRIPGHCAVVLAPVERTDART